MMSPFPQGNAVQLLKWQWWDLRGTEPLGFGGTEQGNEEAMREEESEEPGNAAAWMWGQGCLAVVTCPSMEAMHRPASGS